MNSPELVNYVLMCLKADGLLPKDERPKKKKGEERAQYSPLQEIAACQWLDKHIPDWAVSPTPTATILRENYEPK